VEEEQFRNDIDTWSQNWIFSKDLDCGIDELLTDLEV
jgi:hypothetical protein